MDSPREAALAILRAHSSTRTGLEATGTPEEHHGDSAILLIVA